MATLASSKTFPGPALQAALALSITDGTFANTAYYLYSQRLRNRKVAKPRAVHANREVMYHAAPYFRTRKLIRNS